MRNIKGGYKIINFKGIPLNKDSKVTIDGIYDSIKKSYRKPLLFSGVNIEHVIYPDMFIQAILTSARYEVTLDNVKLYITSDNGVIYESINS